jgi:two-component system, cell cycle sensor histidine kinase and response regulator CckA
MMKSKSAILVVDDQPQNIMLLEGFLVNLGYEIIQATSGEEALEKLSSNRVDLVLLDVKMPKMSGFEVLTKLRADKKTQRIPVIMITAHNETDVRVKALESGCDDFISKPFDRHELFARVKSLLRIKFLNDDVDDAREFAESIINTVREPLISLDQDLRVITVNRSFNDFFKVKPEETVGQLIYDLGNKQWDIPKLRELLETILPQRTTFDDFEVEHDFATIGRRVMLLNARQIKRASGEERIILLSFEDVTVRKQLEDTLADSEMRYRRIYETASDGIVLFEKREGHIVHANPAAEKMLGYSVEESVGKMLPEIGISIDLSDFPGVMSDLDRSGILNYENVSIETRTGQKIDTDIYIVDRAEVAQCNIRDVTEKNLADEKLKEEKTFIVNALNMLKDIFFVLDLDGRFIRWNKAMIDVSGYHEEELVGMKPINLFRNEDHEQVSKAFEKTVEDESASIDAIIVSKNGVQIHYEIKTSLLRDHAGNLMGISGVGRDLTERKKFETQLIQSQKMEAIGTLAGGVAHDFNNMLCVIIGHANLALMGVDPTQSIHVNLEEIRKAAARSADLTRQLLAFARKQTIVPKVLNLNETITGMFNMLKRLIGEAVELKWQPENDLWPVKVDPSQIDQILANLCVNARDSIADVGTITLQMSNIVVDEDYCAQNLGFVTGEYVRLTVLDNGCGMDKNTLTHIFEPFFTTKAVGEGTGLGLATVYGAVKQNGGFINVYSEPGLGTKFTIYLPRYVGNIAQTRQETAEEQAQRGQETILLVEDEPSILNVTTMLLARQGYTVIAANTPGEALNLAREHVGEISLVITDVVMPEMNGRDMAKKLLFLHPDLKFLFMSGYTVDVIAHHCVLDEGVHFIQKPFTMTDLATKVRGVLDSK